MYEESSFGQQLNVTELTSTPNSLLSQDEFGPEAFANYDLEAKLKEKENKIKFPNNYMSFTTEKLSNMLLDALASNNINKLSNILLDAKASSNMLLNYEAPSNILLSRSSHETLQSPLYAASILYMNLDNINELSNMLLDAKASSNMLLNYEALNDILLDTKASSNLLLSQSSHETLQSSSLPTDAALIL
ncbi:hypothetical protein C2G38_2211768 [Gigaspora rosea]|uniref:Uncharacterized protein n=1 Tax=Gigaspora rosea TaxID=44941 RepID=A0A397UM03_9GLOM|nr:hypothetical protein C2G38_2211768 [Gigaspora rosea]